MTRLFETRSADDPIVDRRPMTPAAAVSVFLARAALAVNEARR
jgi:hypothetical protein